MTTWTATDLERFLRWMAIDRRVELEIEAEGIKLRTELSHDPDAWTRVESFDALLNEYYQAFPEDLEEHRRDIPIPVPGARRSSVKSPVQT